MESNEVVKMAKCKCCGIWEECTLDYIGLVKKQFCGAWVCGLCSEAINDEMAALGVGIETAMLIHAKFREISCIHPTIRIARSLSQLLKKTSSSTM